MLETKLQHDDHALLISRENQVEFTFIRVNCTVYADETLYNALVSTKPTNFF